MNGLQGESRDAWVTNLCITGTNESLLALHNYAYGGSQYSATKGKIVKLLLPLTLQHTWSLPGHNPTRFSLYPDINVKTRSNVANIIHKSEQFQVEFSLKYQISNFFNIVEQSLRIVSLFSCFIYITACSICSTPVHDI